MSYRNVGDKKGALTIIDRVTEWDVDTEPLKKHTEYYLQCTCGNEIKIPASNWGRGINDCGCGAWREERRVSMFASVSVRVRDIIEKYASENQMSIAKSLGDLLEVAVETLELKK